MGAEQGCILRKVAVIAPDFAPNTMPPSLCIRFLVSKLPDFGWEPIVITTDPSYYEHMTDPATLQLIPEQLRIIRVQAIPAELTKRVGFSDIGIRSLPHYWSALATLYRQEKVDALLINLPPFVPMVLGRLAYMKFRLPYILNYTDPWRTDYYRRIPKDQRPSKWWLADLMAKTLEPFALRKVSGLIGVSHKTIEQVVVNYPWLDSYLTDEVLCGGDPTDIEFVRNNPRPNQIFDPQDGLIHISSTGHFNPMLRPSAEALFDALQIGLERNPFLFQRVRLHFIGTSYAADASNRHQVLSIAQEKNVIDLVSEHPERLPYLNALQIMLDSHALVMLGNTSPHYTASKVFPYILSCRPILALFHKQSSVITLLDETRAGQFVAFDAEHPITSQAETVYQELSLLASYPKNWQPSTNWNAFEQYSTNAMTKRLAELLDKVVSQ